MMHIYTNAKGFKRIEHKNYLDYIICPESYRHPKEQVEFARQLAKESKNKLKIIYTNSDYIIKELNTLIMLNVLYQKDKEKAEKIMKKFKYSKEELLDHKEVKYFEIKNNKIEEGKVTEEGILVKSIDKVIDKMNKIQNEILFS